MGIAVWLEPPNPPLILACLVGPIELHRHAIPIDGAKLRSDILPDKSVDPRHVAVDPSTAELMRILLFEGPRQQCNGSVKIHRIIVLQ